MPFPFLSENPEAQVLKSQKAPGELAPEEIQEEVQRYLRLLPQVAEPNLGRVREIQEEIRKGTYLTREIVEETANRLTFRFLRKE